MLTIKNISKQKISPSRGYFFKVDKAKLVHYKIIPDFNVVNNSNDSISKAISNLYKTPRQRLNILKRTWCSKRVCCFNIMLMPDQAGFYISIPKEFEDLIVGKIKTIWNNSAIMKVNKSELNGFNLEESELCDLVLKDYNFKSLNTNKDNLFPLTNMVGVTKDLMEKYNEKVRVNFTIEPTKRSNWVNIAKDEYKYYAKGEVVDNEKTIMQQAGNVTFKLIELAISMYIEFKLLILESIIGILMPEKKEDKQTIEVKLDSIEDIKQNNKINGLHSSTTYKMTSEVFNVGISIMSQSKDNHRRNINMLSVANSFKDLNGDNELVVRKLNKFEKKQRFKEMAKFIPRTTGKKIIFSDKEVAKFIQLPQKTLQLEYGLENISNKETEVDENLLKGKIPMGTVECRLEKKRVYWYDFDLDKFMLPKTWQGYSRCGKTTALKNFVVDTSNEGYWNLVIDVNEGDLVDESIQYISNKIPDEKIVVLDFSNPNLIYRLGLSEILSNPHKQSVGRLSGKVGDIMGYLLDSVNDEPLSDRMKRYFNSAVRMCLVNGYTGIDDFRRILEDHKFRCDLIEKSNGKIREKVILDMETLNKMSGKNVTGTRFELISGIIDRLSIMIQTDILEDIFMGTPNEEIDFYKWFNEGYFVGVKAPKGELGIETTNVLITFIVQKAWSSILMRHSIDKKDRVPGFITLDEPHSFPYVCEILTGAIRESAKYRAGFNFAVHDLKDLGVLLPKLKAAGSNFMIFHTDESNLKQAESLIKPFTSEDIRTMKEYHAIHSLVYGDGRIVQDVKTLPEPESRFRKVDRKLIDKYGEVVDN